VKELTDFFLDHFMADLQRAFRGVRDHGSSQARPSHFLESALLRFAMVQREQSLLERVLAKPRTHDTTRLMQRDETFEVEQGTEFVHNLDATAALRAFSSNHKTHGMRNKGLEAILLNHFQPVEGRRPSASYASSA
jgi:hypothetical protein